MARVYRGICHTCNNIGYIYLRKMCWGCFRKAETERKNRWFKRDQAGLSLSDGECARCGRKRKVGKRGFCPKCRETPEVKAKFTFTTPAQQESAMETGSAAPHSKQPTDAKPGSAEKIKVMAGRASRREQLFHPKDYAFREDILYRLAADILPDYNMSTSSP